MIKMYVADLQLERKKIKAHYVKCDSLLELTSYARVHDFEHKTPAGYAFRQDFYGKASFKDALNFNIVTAKEQKQLEKLLAEKVNEFEASITAIRYDVAGNELDVGRVMGGEPECFFEEFEEVKAAKKALIKVNLSTPWKTKKSDITYRGVVVMALCEWLKMKDVSVAVELFNFGEFFLPEMMTKEYQGSYVGVGPLYAPPKKLLFNALTGEFYRRVFHAYTDYFSSCGDATLRCEPWRASEEECKDYDLVYVFNGRFTVWGLDYAYNRVVGGAEKGSPVYF